MEKQIIACRGQPVQWTKYSWLCKSMCSQFRNSQHTELFQEFKSRFANYNYTEW